MNDKLRVEEVTEIEEPMPSHCLFCGASVKWQGFVVFAGPGLSEDLADCKECGHVVSLRNWRAFRHGASQ